MRCCAWWKSRPRRLRLSAERWAERKRGRGRSSYAFRIAIVKNRRSRAHRFFRIEDRGKEFVFDLQAAATLFGSGLGLGRNCRDPHSRRCICAASNTVRRSSSCSRRNCAISSSSARFRLASTACTLFQSVRATSPLIRGRAVSLCPRGTLVVPPHGVCLVSPRLRGRVRCRARRRAVGASPRG